MGAVEKGRVQVSLFLPSGVCVYLLFLHFFFVFFFLVSWEDASFLKLIQGSS